MHIIYKLDPRTKILFVFLFTLFVFFIESLLVCAGFMLSVIALRLAAKIPFREIRLLKILAMLVFFLISVQTLLGPGENFIIKPLFPYGFPLLGGKGSLKWDGLILGLVLSCRLAALMFLLPVLVETTSPYRIAAGLAALGINYRAAFIITTTFNLIPIFREEGHNIMDAQRLRGMRCFEEGSFVERLKAFSGFVIPLVLSAMRRAQAASAAMDSRAFGIYRTRTWLEKPVMAGRDFIFLAAGAVFFVLALTLNYLLI